jgi:hypothetical protein
MLFAHFDLRDFGISEPTVHFMASTSILQHQKAYQQHLRYHFLEKAAAEDLSAGLGAPWETVSRRRTGCE